MSHDPVDCYSEVLDSINQLRQSIATGVSCEIAEGFQTEGQFWETPADRWFEDCEFDPRAL